MCIGEFMKCPNCGKELKDGKLLCEFCGDEIHIVPDFEPEIENKIEEATSAANAYTDEQIANAISVIEF